VDALPAHHKILHYLQETGGATLAQIVDGCDLKEKTATNAISKLRGLGKLPKVAPATGKNKEKWYEPLPD